MAMANLQKRIGVFQEPAGNGVTGLVKSHRLLLVRLEDVALLLHSGHDSFDGLLEVLQQDRFVQVSRRNQRRFVAYVGYVCARESRRQGGHLARQIVLVQIRLERLQMNFEN